jgi:hypothetical protein
MFSFYGNYYLVKKRKEKTVIFVVNHTFALKIKWK